MLGWSFRFSKLVDEGFLVEFVSSLRKENTPGTLAGDEDTAAAGVVKGDASRTFGGFVKDGAVVCGGVSTGLGSHEKPGDF